MGNPQQMVGCLDGDLTYLNGKHGLISIISYRRLIIRRGSPYPWGGKTAIVSPMLIWEQAIGGEVGHVPAAILTKLNKLLNNLVPDLCRRLETSVQSPILRV